ncbi:MAG: hypothetical protein AAF871_08670 [Pseudomonadota bacterium]
MRFFWLVLVLSACAPGVEVARNADTEISTAQSSLALLDWAYLSRLEARAAVLSDGARREYVVLTYVTRIDRNDPAISSAWSKGSALPYAVSDTRRVGPHRQEAGVIRLTESAFRAALRDGLDVTLISARTSHSARIPARLFGEAWRAAEPLT